MKTMGLFQPRRITVHYKVMKGFSCIPSVVDETALHMALKHKKGIIIKSLDHNLSLSIRNKFNFEFFINLPALITFKTNASSNHNRLINHLHLE